MRIRCKASDLEVDEKRTKLPVGWNERKKRTGCEWRGNRERKPGVEVQEGMDKHCTIRRRLVVVVAMVVGQQG